MRKIRDVLRFHLVGQVRSSRQIGRAVGCGRTAVLELLRRAPALGMNSWSDVEALDDEALERLFYPSFLGARGPGVIEQPDWRKIHEELGRRDHQVTVALLWSEYKTENPKGYQYSRFVELYLRWQLRLSVVMRQHHRPGEKTFVDYCDGLKIVDSVTGELIPTQLFFGLFRLSCG